LLRYELRVPSAETSALLGLGSHRPALRLDRLYLIDGRPVALARAWLVPEVGDLSRTTAALMSTEDMMHQAGIAIASCEVTMRAEAAGAAVGRALDISARASVLVLRRRTFGGDGGVKEVGCVWFRSDAYEFVCSTGPPVDAQRLFAIRNVAERTPEFRQGCSRGHE
jgi:GntR family transcriptional regulator